MNTNQRPSIIETIMPGWNGNESIVGYIIRNRNEQRERKAKRARLIRLACITLWPCAALATVIALEPIIRLALSLS